MSTMKEFFTKLTSQFDEYKSNSFESDTIAFGGNQLPGDAQIKDFQSSITKKYGISDYDITEGRPAPIISQLKVLLERGFIKSDFSVIDICCGDALVLMQIKKAFPESKCYGVDFLAGKINTHREVEEAGVELHRVLLQDLLSESPEEKFDIAIMLNIYRSWTKWLNSELYGSALALIDNESSDNADSLQVSTDKWLGSNANYSILTARVDQVLSFPRKGFKFQYLGDGESGSALVCISMNGELPIQLRSRLLFWVYRIRKFLGRKKKSFVKSET